MFGFKKNNSNETPPVPEEQDSAAPKHPASAKKGRPTPKRKIAEAANLRPLITSNKNLSREEKKALRAAERQQRNEYFAKQQEAMRTGDERYLPFRDKGPVRRFIRDFVDSRTTLSEWVVAIAFVMLIVSFVVAAWPSLQRWIVLIAYILMILGLLEAAILWQLCKKQIRNKHPNWEIQRGSAWYFFGRAINLRALRQPRPQVARGEKPE